MSDYAGRLDRLEAALGKATRPNRLIMLTLSEGDDDAEAIAEARRVQGLTPERALIIIDRVAPNATLTC